ncbi:sugar ABC transporter ATP-binding protein [Capillimicrobium parvum]|uniref:Ribose import ATP-binding protein RbsA n=1 Tax=Capillimicrobium parvum TaxID=2884022 RepID=A0A9E6XSF0_9ACTN|nr:sugar ABC transporter ATP-binding protein [Capillimicrobium parvum]UGS33890.1 Ribose import ATP-binding protein RbsA [Capillimicrobium parvum]
MIELRNISKTFASRPVLQGVDLTLVPGEVHGLVGENGSGKSTLIKILSGFHAPDDGAQILAAGRPLELPISPHDANAAGMRFVHQDLGLFEGGSVLENMTVGRYDLNRFWRIDWREERRRAARLLGEFGVALDLDARVGSLSYVERTLLVVVRALGQEAGGGTIVLDEPTAPLDSESAGRLLSTLRRVADRGSSVLFVSHRLGEVLSISDRVTVLRDGRVVAQDLAGSFTEDSLIEAMLGVPMTEMYPEVSTAQGTEVVLALNGFAGDVLRRSVSLELRSGEIVGVTGLAAMGHDDLPYLMFGDEETRVGALAVGDRTIGAADLSPQVAMRAGLGLVPANRLSDGGAQAMTATENITSVTLGKYMRKGTLRLRRERRAVAGLMAQFEIRPPVPELPLASFSGGNQQKAILAKWLSRNPYALILHEPTQGVDVGAKRQIFRLIADAARAGTAFLYVSSEHEDIAHLCTRAVIFRDRAVVRELAGPALTYENLMSECLRA